MQNLYRILLLLLTDIHAYIARAHASMVYSVGVFIFFFTISSQKLALPVTGVGCGEVGHSL